MFSSIEPYAPRERIFLATFSPLFVPQTHTRIPPLFLLANEKIAHVLRLPANQLRTVFFSYKLLDSSVYFPTHPPRPSHISTIATLL